MIDNGGSDKRELGRDQWLLLVAYIIFLLIYYEIVRPVPKVFGFGFRRTTFDVIANRISSASDSANVENMFQAQKNGIANAGGVLVCNELFEVDFTEQVYRIRPLYWQGDTRLLRRCIWFYRTYGGKIRLLDEHTAKIVDLLEHQHLSHFRGQPVGAPSKFRPDAQPLFELAEPPAGVRIRAYSAADIFLFDYENGSSTSRKPSANRLWRGFPVPATKKNETRPIRNLVFIVPGIGQRWFGRTIITDAQKIRKVYRKLKARYLSEKKEDVAFVPLDWRTGMNLNNELLQKLAPKSISRLRDCINGTIMDAVYYVCGRNGDENLRDHFVRVLNGAFTTYMQRDPEFLNRGGRVSIIGHSMGSVLSADAISHGGITIPTRAEAPTLNFKVHHLYLLGSPLGAPAVCNKLSCDGIKDLAKSTKLFNIMHGSDPVAFRIEPLIDEIYADLDPVPIHACHSKKRYRNTPNGGPSVTDPKAEGAEGPRPVSTDGASPLLTYRVDHQLAFGKMERYVSEYASVMTAHTRYWKNVDLVMFVMTMLEMDA